MEGKLSDHQPRTRRQLSLFVPERTAAPIEAMRRLLDPVQHRLIPAHVTLCREDEIGALDVAALRDRVAAGKPRPITLHFGRPEGFLGHGILLPCIAGQEEFQALREFVLGRTDIKPLPPHLTLAHPRNPRAVGNSLSAAGFPSGLTIGFDAFRLIEQIGTEPWQALRTITLPG